MTSCTVFALAEALPWPGHVSGWAPEQPALGRVV